VNLYAILQSAVLVLHLLWIVWIVCGWIFTRGRPLVACFHVASLIWGIAVELGPCPCPLTLAEQWLEARSGADSYHQSFLVHYLDRLVYPDLPEAAVAWTGAAVCVLILGIYGRRVFRHRRLRAN
jgi:hypothetical protein